MEGEIFRQLRKDRRMSMGDVSDEVNSLSFISKI